MKDRSLFQTPETHIVQVTNVRYHDGDSMFSVMDVEEEDGTHFVAVGEIPQPLEGNWYRIVGTWKEHPRFGRQFRIREAAPAEPNSMEGLVSFLTGARLRGVGQSTARKIVEYFGDRTIDVLDNQPDRLLEVPGIGLAKARQIRESWESFREERNEGWDHILSLTKLGIPYSLAGSIVKVYGADALSVVKENPYKLIEDVSGIGFMRADAIARNVGIPEDSSERMAAAMVHVLQAASDDEGHVYLLARMVYDRALDLLVKGATQEISFSRERFLSILEDLRNRRVVVVQEGGGDFMDTARVYLRRLYRAEERVASRIAALLATAPSFEPPDREEIERIIVEDLGLTRDERQIQAVLEALSSKFAIITGGPGTGKTTIVRAIVEFAADRGLETFLAAPTGRAAKRLSESTGMEAKTIHRLLQYHPSHGFQHNAENPLYCDILVVDETSMVDVTLMSRLLDAVPMETHVILVGDHNQLPSVGPGAVLRDLISSGSVPTVRLSTVFRQAHDSMIVQNAMAVLAGAGVRTGRGPLGDVGWALPRVDDPYAIRGYVVHLVTSYIPENYGIDVHDIQVLTPMNRGVLGTEELNYALQNRINPDGEVVLSRDSGKGSGQGAHQDPERVWRVGDRVIQLRNNYDLDVYNGDMGIIRGVDTASDEVYLEFYGRLVKRPRSDLGTEMALAYAITIHKSQGSEFPAVVLPLHTQHWIMLRRSLLYTAVTRAKRVVALVGPHKAVYRAVRNAEDEKRLTSLAERVSSLVGVADPS